MYSKVLVVGGGPSGLVVASELALAGVDVTVFERRTGLVQSRAGTILPRVLELLDSRGLAQQFIDRAATILPHPLFRTHMWAGMKPIEWRHLESRFGYRLVLPQNHTEELLLEHALACGVTFERGVTVEGVIQHDDGIEIGLVDEHGERRAATGDYLVGCDGGRSVVREKAGFETVGHDTTFTGIVADIVLDNPWPDGRRIVDNDKGWFASFPFGEGITRFNIVHAERMHADPAEPVSVEEVRRCIRDVLEADLEFEDLQWGSRFSDTSRIAMQFARDRIFLVGESARIHYPASGVGMNFCIQDAFNLGWKLAAVVNGYAEASLLKSYDSERRPVAEALMRSVASQCSVQFDFTPEGMIHKRWFESTILPLPDVNRRLALELNGLAVPYAALDRSHSMVGERMPDLEIRLPDGVTTVGALLRSHHFVVLDLTGEERLTELKYADAPVDVASGVPTSLPDRLRTATTILVRPDGYVGWVDTGRSDSEQVRNEVGQWLPYAR